MIAKSGFCVALCACAGTCAAPPATAFLRVEVASPAWEAVAVGPHERSLFVVYLEGGCLGSGATSTTAESARTVTISVQEEAEEPQGSLEACATWSGYRELTVTLARPLAGRHIIGPRGAIEPSFAIVFDGPHGGARVTVPRLVGFSPEDAKRAIASRGLRVRVRRAPPRAGLAQVVAQRPRPGSVLRRGGTIDVQITR